MQVWVAPHHFRPDKTQVEQVSFPVAMAIANKAVIARRARILARGATRTCTVEVITQLGMGYNTKRICVRAVGVLLGMAIWFTTQSLLGHRVSTPTSGIGDYVLDLLGPYNLWLHSHMRVADGLLIATSLVIDALVVSCFLVVVTLLYSMKLFTISLSLFGVSSRPFLATFITLIVRQACQGMCSLPSPYGIIWHNPGFPSLFVTYSVTRSFFLK